MSTSTSSTKMPADPDPTPMASSSHENVDAARREEQKRSVKKNSRLKTIIAGDPTAAADPAAKKNILG